VNEAGFQGLEKKVGGGKGLERLRLMREMITMQGQIKDTGRLETG